MVGKRLRVLGKSVLLLLAGALAGTALLTLAYLLPINPEKRDDAYTQLVSEGWYPRATISNGLKQHFYSYFPDVLDTPTDRIMLFTALDIEEGDPLTRAMNAHSATAGNYSYYWHGYVALLRPLFLFFDLAEVRMLNGICQFLLMFFLAGLIGKKKGIGHVWMFVTAYALLMPMAVSRSFQFSWVFYIGYIGTFVLLSHREYFSEKSRYLYFFLTLGMLTSYFDLLTYPLFTWGIPLVWWIVMEERQEKAGFWIRRVISTALGWIAGYALFWVMKWVLAGVVLDRDIFTGALDEVFLRAGTLAEDTYGILDRCNAIYDNWKYYEYPVYTILLVGWLIAWLYRLIKKGGWGANPKRYAYFLIGLSGFVWYFVLSNHTSIHRFFTYRIMNVTLLAFLALVLDSGRDGRKGSMAKQRARLGLVLAGTALLSILPTLLAREGVDAANDAAEFCKIELPQGARLETTFTPTFDVIRHFSLGLECKGQRGEFLVKIGEADTPEYQTAIRIAWGEAKSLQGMDVDWRMKSGKTYRMTVEVRESREPVYAWVTEGGKMHLIEYGALYVDGRAVEGQLLTGIQYWALPIFKKRLVFLAASWFGALLATIVVFLPGGKLSDNQKILPI